VAIPHPRITAVSCLVTSERDWPDGEGEAVSDEQRINELISKLDANLADESDILSHLRDGSLAIEELSEKLGCSLITLSRKLCEMNQAGKVEVYTVVSVMFVRRKLSQAA
jgi:predicted Rossmann fold nucleotide-binding protein DprA/Smf involved in DNA uptake